MTTETKVEDRLKFSLAEFKNIIKKYRENDIEQVVYILSYAGKFIIVRGKTLAGSLITISEGLFKYRADVKNERFNEHLYRKFYDHLLNSNGRLRVKVIDKADENTDQFQLLKSEQMEIDKHSQNENNLNAYTEVYIPKYNKKTGMYGWLTSEAVRKYEGWMISKRRVQQRERYQFKRKK